MSSCRASHPLVTGPAMLVALLASGCATVEPYAEVRARLPEERFLEVAGASVYVEQWGRGEPVVLVHGFGGSSRDWSRVAGDLAERYRLIAPDLRGFGWSERPRERELYAFDNQVSLVLGVMDELGLESAHVVGHSYGGGVALWLAHRAPERVRSLVLVDSTLPGTGLDSRERFPRAGPFTPLAVRWILRESFLRNALESSYHDPTLVDDALVEATLERLAVEGVNRAFRGLTARSARPSGTLDPAALDLPTLVVWGADDPILPADSGRRLAEAVPRGRFVEIPECGHIPMDEAPEAFVAAVEPFLDEHALRR